MRILGIVLASMLVCGCSLDSDKVIADAERELADYIEVGDTLASVRSSIEAKSIEYREISVEECGEFFMFPEYKCEGGSALRLLLSENAHPWSPFYSPSLHAFLAFDQDQNLSKIIVQLEGDS